MVRIEWRRGEMRFARGFAALATASFAALLVAALLRERPGGAALAALITAAVGFLAWQLHSVVIQPDPTLELRPDRLILRHPLLLEPLELSLVDIHSVWMGPFDQPPVVDRRRAFWVGRPSFPRELIDLSEHSGNGGDLLVVAFSRTLGLEPRLRVSPWVLIALRMYPPFVARRHGNGLCARVADRSEAEALIASSGRTRKEMPRDVKLWLGWPPDS